MADGKRGDHMTKDELLLNIGNYIENLLSKGADKPCEGEENMGSTKREYYTYVDAQGMQQTIRINGNSKQDCDLQFQNLLISNSGGSIRNTKGDILLKDFIETVFKPCWYDESMSKNTIANYNYYFRMNIYPFFDGKTLNEANDEVQIRHFNQWMAEAQSHGRVKNLAEDTIRRIDSLLYTVFDVAKRKKYITETVFETTVKGIKVQGEKSRHHEAIPDDVMDHIKAQIPYISIEMGRYFIGLLAYTGIRPEEALGLRCEDIDFEKGVAHIERAVIHPDKNKPIVKTTKTQNSVRIIIIPKPLLNILSPLKEQTGYVIHGRDAEAPICYSSYTRIYRIAQKELGIKGKWTNYNFRSTFATQLKESGMPLATCADLMGHADTRMMQKVYAPARDEGILKQQNFIEQLNQKYIKNEAI